MYGRFPDELHIVDTDRSVRGRAYWRLTRPFAYEVGAAGSGMLVTVPIDYETDFASIPPAFWWIYPPTGRYRKAAVIHDWLYSASGCSRVIADAVFLEAMNSLGVPKWQRWPIYLAVRLFGWIYYKQGARNESNQ